MTVFIHLNIVHTVCHDQWGGLEQRVFNESRWMAERGHKIVIVAPPGSPLFENAAAQGWTVWPMGFARARMPADLSRLRRLLRAARPDVLNTHGNADTKVGLPAAAGLGIPCVILSRHVSPAVRNSWYTRRLYRDLCHFVLTTSDAASRQIERDLGVPGARIRTIPSGIIPPAALISRAAARAKVAEMLNLPGASRFIGYLGRIASDKGLSDIVSAFSGIRKWCPDHHLVLVGEGDFRTTLISQIRDAALEGRVHMAGFHEERWSWLRAFDCKVTASRENDGIPQAVLEAMFARCPVIGTAVGGIPDIIRHERTGLLVPPKDPSRLGAAILETIRDPRAARRRAAAAERFAFASHTIDCMGETLLAVYREVISKEHLPSQML